MKSAGVLLFVLVLAGCGSTKTVTQTVTKTVTKTVVETQQCSASELSAAFDVVPGSQGAGNIVYVLTIKNTASSGCELALTGFQLLDQTGASNPTNVTPPTGTKLLAAGETVRWNARFSPDVTGTGDNTTAGGQCQPTSATLRINGSIDAPVSPPTPVCEKGSMTLTPA